VAIIVARVLIAEYNDEKSLLKDYTTKVNAESENRANILSKYQERDTNLARIITLEKEINNIADKMAQTDCANQDTCRQVDLWNSLYDKLDNARDEKESLMSKSKTAISKQNKINKPDELWLLDMLGFNNSEELSNKLASYSVQINDKFISINSKIDQIEALEKDCNHPPVITCTSFTEIDLEKE
jgi:hypothetical protein